MDYYMIMGKDLTEQNIKHIVELDEVAYEEKYLITFEKAFERFQRNKHIYICLYSKNHDLIGYVSILPIGDGLYNRIKQGQFENDKDIPIDDILEYKSDRSSFNIYLSSIVTHPDYAGAKTIIQLIKGIILQIEDLSKNGVTFGNMLAFLIPEKKGRLERLLGFKTIGYTTNGMPVIEGNIRQMIKYNNRTGKFASI